MRHATKVPAYKRITTYVVGLSLVGVTGFCIGGLLSSEGDTPKQKAQTVGPEVPGSSEDAPKTAEEGQSRKDQSGKDQSLGPTDVPQSPESLSPAERKAAGTESTSPTEEGTEGPEKSSVTPAPRTPAQSHAPGQPSNPPTKETPKPPAPEKPIYQFFIADDSAQNRTWCDTHPSGSVKVELGTMYKSYYNDNDPAKAWASWRVSKEDTTCP